MVNKVKTKSEISYIRQSGKMLATVLKAVEKAIEPGITTLELNDIAKKELKSLGGEPAFLGYYGYPGVICISVNDEVVHGIPGKYIIKNGDIVSFDYGVKYGGMITDAARSILVGPNNKQKLNLINGTLESLDAGIGAIKEGAYIGDISESIQSVLDEYGFGIVRDLVGHGVGHELHEDPNIPNYGKSGTGMILKEGMTLALEPMTTLGSYKVYTAADGWTILTRDGSLSAHFEDTVLVTKNGSEILTRL